MSEVKKDFRKIFKKSYRLKTDDSSEETVFYEAWQLNQRVLLANVAILYISTLDHITLIVMFVDLFYFMCRLYKPER